MSYNKFSQNVPIVILIFVSNLLVIIYIFVGICNFYIYLDKKPWNTPQRHTVRKVFQEHISEGRLPSLAECKQAVEQNSCLNNEINRKKRSQ